MVQTLRLSKQIFYPDWKGLYARKFTLDPPLVPELGNLTRDQFWGDQ